MLNFSWPSDGVQGPSDCGPRGQDSDPVATLHPRLHPHQHPARHLPPHRRGVSGLRSGQRMYIALLYISSRRRWHLRCVNFVSIRHGPDILTIVCAPGHAGDLGGRQFYNGANAPWAACLFLCLFPKHAVDRPPFCSKNAGTFLCLRSMVIFSGRRRGPVFCTGLLRGFLSHAGP